MLNVGTLLAILRLKDELSAQVDKTRGKIGQLGASINKLGETRVSFTALAAATAAFTAAVVASVKAFDEQVDSINSLNLALANQGNLLPGTSGRLQEYASGLQRVTTYGDEVILKNQALLASFGMNEDQLRTTTKVALDFASATGRDLAQAVNLLGKAFVGETGELSRYGIIIDRNIPKSEKFAAVIQQMTDRFGGQAQAQTATLSGRFIQLRNAIGDATEGVGKFVSFMATSFGGSMELTMNLLGRVRLFFARDLIIALGYFRKGFSELVAFILNGIATLSGPFAKLADFLGIEAFEVGRQAVLDWAAAQREAGEALLEEALAAAGSSEATLEVANAANIAAPAIDAVTDAAEHADETLQIGVKTWGKYGEEMLETKVGLESWVPTIKALDGPLANMNVQVGMAAEKQEKAEIASFSWQETMGGLTRVMGDAGNVLSVFGVNVDSIVGKITRFISGITSLVDSLGGLLGMFKAGGGLGGFLGGLFGGPGGGAAAEAGETAGAGILSGLGSVLKGGLSSLGSTMAPLFTNPFTAAIGAGIGAFFGLKALFGGPSNFERAGEELANSFGESFDEALRWHLVNQVEELGIDMQEAIQRNLGEVFKRALETIDPGELDTLMQRAADTFSYLERGEISAAEASKILSEAIPQILPHIDQLGEEGQAQLERLIAAADRFGVTFTGLDELMAGPTAPQTMEEIAEQFDISNEQARQLAEQLGVNLQTNLERMASTAGLSVDEFRELADVVKDEFGVGMEDIDDLAASMGVSVAELAEALGVDVKEGAEKAEEDFDKNEQHMQGAADYAKILADELERAAIASGGINIPTPPGGGGVPVVPAQHEFVGTVHRPTLFLAGEGNRPEHVSIRHADGRQSPQPTGRTVVHEHHWHIGGATFLGTEEEFIRRMESWVRNNRGGFNTAMGN